MMLPPACASALPLETTESSPSWRRQLLAGKASEFGLCQPSVVLPSQSNFQPSAFSCALNVLFSLLISRRRRWRKDTFSPTLLVSCPTPWTCRAITPRGVRLSVISARNSPFSQVLMDGPFATMRSLFHSLGLLIARPCAENAMPCLPFSPSAG